MTCRVSYGGLKGIPCWKFWENKIRFCVHWIPCRSQWEDTATSNLNHLCCEHHALLREFDIQALMKRKLWMFQQVIIPPMSSTIRTGSYGYKHWSYNFDTRFLTPICIFGISYLNRFGGGTFSGWGKWPFWFKEENHLDENILRIRRSSGWNTPRCPRVGGDFINYVQI